MMTLYGCGGSENLPAHTGPEENLPAPYDTVAVDSFSAGAISVDIAAQIRMSSQAYQDSLKVAAEALKKAAEAKKAAEISAKEKASSEKSKDEKSKTTMKKNEVPAKTPEVTP